MKLMMFLTGSEVIPPLGAPSVVKVSFKHDCTKSSEGLECACFPVVSTCSYTLVLPMHIKNDDEMKDKFLLAITKDFGFGRC